MVKAGEEGKVKGEHCGGGAEQKVGGQRGGAGPSGVQVKAGRGGAERGVGWQRKGAGPSGVQVKAGRGGARMECGRSAERGGAERGGRAPKAEPVPLFLHKVEA